MNETTVKSLIETQNGTTTPTMASTDLTTTLTTTSITESPTKIHQMVWEMEITEKQKRKEMKRHRRLQKGKNVKEKLDQAGCDVPVFLLSRGIHFDRSGERSSKFAPGTKLILHCENGAKPFPKARAKCKCQSTGCSWSKLQKIQCLKL